MAEAGYSTITDRTPDFEDILWEESIREAFKRVNEYELADEERQFWLDRDRMLEAMQDCLSQRSMERANLSTLCGSAALFGRGFVHL